MTEVTSWHDVIDTSNIEDKNVKRAIEQLLDLRMQLPGALEELQLIRDKYDRADYADGAFVGKKIQLLTETKFQERDGQWYYGDTDVAIKDNAELVRALRAARGASGGFTNLAALGYIETNVPAVNLNLDLIAGNAYVTTDNKAVQFDVLTILEHELFGHGKEKDYFESSKAYAQITELNILLTLAGNHLHQSYPENFKEKLLKELDINSQEALDGFVARVRGNFPEIDLSDFSLRIDQLKTPNINSESYKEAVGKFAALQEERLSNNLARENDAMDQANALRLVLNYPIEKLRDGHYDASIEWPANEGELPSLYFTDNPRSGAFKNPNLIRKYEEINAGWPQEFRDDNFTMEGLTQLIERQNVAGVSAGGALEMDHKLTPKELELAKEYAQKAGVTLTVDNNNIHLQKGEKQADISVKFQR